MSDHLQAIDNFHQSKLRLSFEFFPPKSEHKQRCLWRNIGQLELLSPSFFSVTYGAGGSDRENSLEVLRQLNQECPVPLAAHLTHAGHSKSEVLDIATSMYEQGIRSLVALRGDAPSVSGGFENTAEFVAALAELAGFDISVAAYPETHPLASSSQSDMEQLALKLQAGADRAITQYFFDSQCYLRFRDRAAALGICKPLLPGILPIHQFDRVVAFSQRCGTSVPKSLFGLFEGTEGNTEVQHALATDLAVNLCQELIDEGVRDLHFYTLNTAALSFNISRQLGVPLSQPLASVA